MNRPETTREEIETIVQKGYVAKQTAAETTDAIMVIVEREVEHAKVMEMLK